MGQQLDTSLESRIAALETAARAARAGAALGTTAIAARNAATHTITGPANAAGLTSWERPGPDLDVLVTGGRLRVEFGAAMYAQHGAAYMSYDVLGPVDREQDLLAAAPGALAVFRAPPFDASAFIYSTAGTTVGVNAGFANFDLVEDMPPGWYRIRSCYAYRYLVSTTGGSAYWEYRRLAATRF